MIIEKNQSLVKTNLIGEEEEFKKYNIGVHDINAFKNLILKLYKNCFRIIPQELASNGIDASRENQNGFPYDAIIRLDHNGRKYVFTCQDFGTGMSPEKVEKVYTQIGASDKTKDDIGGYGYGSKTPLTYEHINSFLVTTVYEGIKYVYTVEGLDSISLYFTEETDEPSGTTIEFEVANLSDCERFIQQACDIFYCNPRVLIDTNISVLKERINELYEKANIVFENKDYLIFKRNKIYLNLGDFLIYGIPYSFNEEYTSFDRVRTALKVAGYILIPKIDNVQPLPTRESYYDIAVNKQNIYSQLDKVVEEVSKKIKSVPLNDLWVFKDDRSIEVAIPEYDMTYEDLLKIHSDNSVFVSWDTRQVLSWMKSKRLEYIKNIRVNKDFKVTPYRKKQLEKQGYEIVDYINMTDTQKSILINGLQLQPLFKKDLIPLKSGVTKDELERVISFKRPNLKHGSKYTLQELFKSNINYSKNYNFCVICSESDNSDWIDYRYKVILKSSKSLELIKKYKDKLHKSIYLYEDFINSRVLGNELMKKPLSSLEYLSSYRYSSIPKTNMIEACIKYYTDNSKKKNSLRDDVTEFLDMNSSCFTRVKDSINSLEKDLHLLHKLTESQDVIKEYISSARKMLNVIGKLRKSKLYAD